MQPELSLAPPMPMLMQPLSLPMPGAPEAGKVSATSLDFGEELAKLLGAPTPISAPAQTTTTTAAPKATEGETVLPVAVATTQADAAVQQSDDLSPLIAVPVPPTDTAAAAQQEAIPRARLCRDAPAPRRGGTLPTAETEMPADLAAVQPPPAEAPPVDCPAPVADIIPEPAMQRPEVAQPEMPPLHDAAPRSAQPALARPEASQVKAPISEPAVSPPIPEAPGAKPAQTPASEAAPPSLPVSPDPAPRTAPAATESTAPPLPSHQATSPAAQVAPVLVRLSHAPDGAQRLTVRLDPPELGHVQVRIDRPPQAPARVEILVEKAETLQMLLRDQPQLQRALDQAGVPPEGRSVSFHIAAPEPAPRSEPLTAPAAGVAAGGLSGDGSHGTQRQGEQAGHQQGHTHDAAEPDAPSAALTGWVRGGLDITA